MTAKDGTFTLGPLAAGEVAISVFSDLGKTQAKSVAEAGATVTCNPVIPSSASIVGIVVDESDAPQRGWSLMATSRDGGGLLTGLTDASGRFALKNAGDHTYTITAYAPGPGEDIPSAWAEDVNASTRDLTLRVSDATRRSCWIEGNLVDSGGSSVAGADIHIYARPTLYGGSHYSEEGTGHFKIGPLPPAEYSIEIVPPKAGRLRFPWKKLSPRENWDLGTLTLPAAGKLLLRYQRSAGVPVARPSIYLENSDGKPSGAAFADSSADGSRTEWITAGDYWVHAGGEGFATDRIPCVVRAGEETSVDVPLRAGSRRWLALRNAIAGTPQIDARLEVREEGKEQPILSFESFGISAGKPLRFPIDLAPGTYEVRLTDNGARETKKTIVVKGAPDPAADVELELR
jgi:hypothetical protein